MAVTRVLRRASYLLPQIRQYSAPAERAVPAAKQKYVPTSGEYPKGFLAGSSHAGVKESNTQYDDISLVVSEKPCTAAAVFTRNIFQAAPVITSKEILSNQQNRGNIRGVVVNSGCANAVTGTAGREDSLLMASTVDRLFGHHDTEVPGTIVMSTGVIGKRLPIKKIVEAIPKAQAALGQSHQHWMSAARAICTTDTFPKLISRTFRLPSQPNTTYTIAGMTKGAGMIHPNMGTLLGIICTDVNIAPDSIREFLLAGNKRSFNCISVDGDTSTNDTVALLANGAAAPEGLEALSMSRGAAKPSNPDTEAFISILSDFMADLAQLVVRDGEGATKFVTIRVASDTSYAVAKAVAESIATSPLVKTALYGKDANWGRILCAIGYTPGLMAKDHLSEVMSRLEQEKDRSEKKAVTPSTTSVSFKPADGSEILKLLVRGEPQDVDEVRAKQILEMEDLEIVVQLDDHDAEATRGRKAESTKPYGATFWTCDFSHEYVTINGDYRT